MRYWRYRWGGKLLLMSKMNENLITENNKCPFDNMDNQKCHAFNDGDCMNGIVCDKEGEPPK